MASAYKSGGLFVHNAQNFGGAPTGEAREISIIPYRQQFVKRKVVQKSKSLDARICALCHVDFWGGVWYYNGVKGRDNTPKGLDLRVGIGNDPQKLGREKKS